MCTLDHFSALHFACLDNHQDIVKILIEAKIEPNGPSSRQQSAPIHLAAANGHLNCLTYLLKAGADVDIRDSHNNTPLHHACRSCFTDVALSLVRAGADIDAKNDAGRTTIEVQL